MPMKPTIEVSAPERLSKPEIVGMEIHRKYGKFHGHMEMADGAMHHLAPHPTMMEAHKAMGEHLMANSDEREAMASENEKAGGEEQAGPATKYQAASEPANEDVNA